MARTKQGKTRDCNQPYEVYVIRENGVITWEWRVVKKYQSPEAEADNQYARWCVAVKSPMSFSKAGRDSYINDIREYGELAYREAPGSPNTGWQAEWYTLEEW